MTKTFVICRRASDPLVAGYKTGYQCFACNQEVQASPTAVEQIVDGASVVCNDCGLLLIAAARHTGKLDVLAAANPDARDKLEEYLRRGGLDR